MVGWESKRLALGLLWYAGKKIHRFRLVQKEIEHHFRRYVKAFSMDSIDTKCWLQWWIEFFLSLCHFENLLARQWASIENRAQLAGSERQGYKIRRGSGPFDWHFCQLPLGTRDIEEEENAREADGRGPTCIIGGESYCTLYNVVFCLEAKSPLPPSIAFSGPCLASGLVSRVYRFPLK